jgi:hypothetical protein
MPTMIRLRKAPRCEFVALQRLRNRAPFLFTPFRERPAGVARPTGVPPTGFGYPLGGISARNLGSIFQPPTLMGFALQSFPPARRSGIDFSNPLPLSRFLAKPYGLTPAPQRFHPTGPAAPLAPRMINPGLGRLLSWAFGLSGSPSVGPLGKHLSSPNPSRSFLRATLPSPARGAPGAALPTAWLSPSVEGAGPSGLSHRLPSATP